MSSQLFYFLKNQVTISTKLSSNLSIEISPRGLLEFHSFHDKIPHLLICSDLLTKICFSEDINVKNCICIILLFI